LLNLFTARSAQVAHPENPHGNDDARFHVGIKPAPSEASAMAASRATVSGYVLVRRAPLVRLVAFG
jgi:hypothetical protein